MNSPDIALIERIRTLLDCYELEFDQHVQSLWSGYGQIVKLVNPTSKQRYIVKWVAPDGAEEHPRGWDGAVGHDRKVTSYQMESHFYQYYSPHTDSYCQVAKLHAHDVCGSTRLIIMDDLDAAGFSIRLAEANWSQLKITLRWLAYFHGCFMNTDADGLWPVGTYWHLATRRDEWQSMTDSPFKKYAADIDSALNNAKFQTLVHGDSKLANFCYHTNSKDVAAVDFQYVGRGCGVKDLAYLVGSALHEDDLAVYGDRILNEYIHQLKLAVKHYNINLDIDELEQEVRFLYPIAWADFYRFLLGWNPKSWKICGFMRHMSKVGLSRVI
ncbi:phosphotransferase [Alteromonas sp. 5E99-2]|uniref:DUF1679 domain-containing protein n=1 Tax=Alteromonas sp. 5E99-2 TaxID=2817683 RepID=UPI001A97FC1C|nr:DUF1679 domain-containing protein [Alteromonas sp. 5E99-2]MBO1254671.1 phosphotransferase [Alteromonas sp. 5E99-2]